MEKMRCNADTWTTRTLKKRIEARRHIRWFLGAYPLCLQQEWMQQQHAHQYYLSLHFESGTEKLVTRKRKGSLNSSKPVPPCHDPNGLWQEIWCTKLTSEVKGQHGPLWHAALLWDTVVVEHSYKNRYCRWVERNVEGTFKAPHLREVYSLTVCLSVCADWWELPMSTWLIYLTLLHFV